MQDPYVIMGTGFKNTVEKGNTGGYQLNIRIPYYRSVYLSAVHQLDLEVDGEAVPASDIRIVVAGKTFTIAQMFEADSVRWGFGDPATLLVRKAGGLKPGVHAFKIGIVIRKSYLPATDPEHLYEDFPGLYKDGKYSTYIEAPTVITKKMTLVQ
jgi:Domain of unknown function (DUF6379)